MKLVKIGAASLNQTPLDWEHNYNNIISVIDDAVNRNVNILLLPELCVTGYGCEDAFFMPEVLKQSRLILWNINTYIRNKYSNKIVVILGSPYLENSCIYNGAAILGDEAHIALKQNLCADGIHYEPRWFKTKDHKNYKNKIFNLSCDGTSIKFGIEICEDAWVQKRPAICLASKGAEIIFNLSASHFSFGKHKVRRALVEQSSREFNCCYVYANLVGNEAGRVIYDGDTYIASDGKIVAEGPRLHFSNYKLITSTVDLDKNNIKRWQSHSFEPKITRDIPVHIIGENYKNNKIESKPGSNNLYYPNYGSVLDVNNDEFASFTKACSLGLWDYMRKTKSAGFVVSLSGGADSAAVACLVRSMVICAYNECPDFYTVLKSIGIEVPKDLEPEDGVKYVCNNLLTAVYQKAENSSQTTLDAAKHLAKEIGADFHDIDISKIVEDYTVLSERMLDRKLSWEKDDIALQNIQARVRGPSVWMMANVRNQILLCTSNRSEAAVGYCTIDGDSCGGLSPIAGVSKQFILDWLKDYHRTEIRFGFNGLDKVIKLQPTAELKPSEQRQTDEEDLMPYPLLNEIETMFVKHKMSIQEITRHLSERGQKNAQDSVIKFFKLFTRNQWKRERYAPSFHLDDESLDPKTFFRFPILNSGFRAEINKLLESNMKDALE